MGLVFITRFLREKDYTSRELWLAVKPFVGQVESANGVFILDDSVEERQYMEENEIICWHWDHSQNRTVKGVNQLTLRENSV